MTILSAERETSPCRPGSTVLAASVFAATAQHSTVRNAGAYLAALTRDDIYEANHIDDTFVLAELFTTEQC